MAKSACLTCVPFINESHAQITTIQGVSRLFIHYKTVVYITKCWLHLWKFTLLYFSCILKLLKGLLLQQKLFIIESVKKWMLTNITLNNKKSKTPTLQLSSTNVHVCLPQTNSVVDLNGVELFFHRQHFSVLLNFPVET